MQTRNYQTLCYFLGLSFAIHNFNGCKLASLSRYLVACTSKLLCLFFSLSRPTPKLYYHLLAKNQSVFFTALKNIYTRPLQATPMREQKSFWLWSKGPSMSTFINLTVDDLKCNEIYIHNWICVRERALQSVPRTSSTYLKKSFARRIVIVFF